jgi:hypothetical protein
MKNLQGVLVWLLVAGLTLPWPMRLDAQTAGQSSASAPPAASAFKPEEIEQMVAPIALYPDSLVSQILMASTYPLEVVEADRWAKQNKNLKGDPLTTALEQKSWDPSIKSLVQFPQVLSMMSEKLEMTQRLGDAVLAQQKDVLDAIQRLRAKAQASGNLKTTQEQKVIVEQAPAASQTTTIIKIEPANPQVVYVPSYNPTVVYGPWAYPAYPPYSYYPPGYVAGTAFAFASGVALGAAWGYAWGGCNWGRGDVDVDINRNTTFNQNINRESHRTNVNQSGKGNWQHDASHRKGVSYRDNNTAQKYNKGTNAQAAQARADFRGRTESGGKDLARTTSDRGAAGGGQKSTSGADRGGAAKQGAGDRGAGSSERREAASSNAANRSDAGRSSGGTRQADAFQGLGGGGDVRSASSRGASSRASGGGSRGGGGGSRGGGGGGGGRR